MYQKGGAGISFFLFLAIIGILMASMFVSPSNNLPAPKIIKQTIITQTQPKQHTLQEIPFRVETTYAPTTGGNGTTTIIVCNDPYAGDINNLSTIVNSVRVKYGLDLSGDALTTTKALLVYNDMCKVYQSPKYKQNLNTQSVPINIAFVYTGSCFAYTFSATSVQLQEPCTDLVDAYILIHELTHTMQRGSNFGRNAYFNIWSQLWTTEQFHKIPTGPCVFEDPGDGGECEADAVAEYVYYEDYRNSWGAGPPPGKWISGINGNYPTEWNNWYCFVQKNIFGGTTFYANSPICP